MLIFQRYTWWLGAMLGLAVLMTAASQVGFLGPFQGAFVRVVAPLESGMHAIVTPVADVLSGAGNVREIQEENQRLRLQLEELQNEVVSLRQQAEQAEDLRQALGIIGDNSEQQFELASVVSRDASPFTDVVRIDKGSNDGIRSGMVVRSAQGSLVGTVVQVFATRSSVRLISDARSAVNAQILGSEIDGSVQGTPTRTIKLQLARGTINVGDQVVTSGVGDNYPRGLPIGTVKQVAGTPQDIFLDVTIEPHVRLSTLETVLIDTSFDPSRRALETP